MKDDIWELIQTYSKQLHAVDYWSGSVKNSAFLTPAYETNAKLEIALGVAENHPIWALIEDYSKKLHAVDYWSGNVKNSAFLTPAYEVTRELEFALSELKPSIEISKKHKP